MGVKFRIENGEVIRTSGPPSKEELARVRRNRRNLTSKVPAARAEASAIEREVTRRINGRTISEQEFQADRAARREQLDANLTGILESGQFPGVTGDDSTFQNCLYDSQLERRYSPEKLARMTAAARAAGKPVTKGWEYYPTLAKYEGDPAGWVGPTTTRGDIAKQIAAEGNGCKELGVKVRPPESDPNRRVHRLAPDLVKEEVRKRFAKDPGLAANCRRSKKKLNEVKQDVIATHGAKSDTFQ